MYTGFSEHVRWRALSRKKYCPACGTRMEAERTTHRAVNAEGGRYSTTTSGATSARKDAPRPPWTSAKRPWIRKAATGASAWRADRTRKVKWSSPRRTAAGLTSLFHHRRGSHPGLRHVRLGADRHPGVAHGQDRVRRAADLGAFYMVIHMTWLRQKLRRWRRRPAATLRRRRNAESDGGREGGAAGGRRSPVETGRSSDGCDTSEAKSDRR